MNSEAMQVRDASASYRPQAGAQDVPPGYKRTEVGVIPEDWEIKPLSAVAIFTNGKAHEGCISDIGKYIVVNSKFISTNGEVLKYTDQRFSPASSGEILMVMSDVPNGRAIARCFLVDHDDLYTVNQRICALRPIEVDGNLLLYKLDRNPYYLGFDDGVKQTNLRKVDVLSCPLALPSTEIEQRAIAEALSDVGGLLGALEALIAKKRAIKQAAMQQLLTGKTRLPGFSGEWETKRLGDIASFYKGAGLSKANLSPDGRRRCIHYGELFTTYGERIEKITSGTDQEGDFFLSVRNDVLMPTSDVTPNGLATASCITISDVILGGDILVIRAPENKLNGEFLAYSVKVYRNQVMQLVSGTTVFHLYGRDMANFVFSLPSTEEQTAITTALSDMDAEIAALETRRDKTRALKQGMMQQLLTGRVRLVKLSNTEVAC